jgi:mono/diheme cytochrome c family protein
MRSCAPTLVCLIVIAGCGGERRAPASDSSQVGRTADSTAATGTDTVAAVKPDTSRSLPAVKESTAAPAQPGTSVARPSVPPAETTVAKKPVTKPVAAKTDTAKAAPAETTTQTAEAPLRDAYHQAPRDTVSQQVYTGWKQFNLNCARCHGEDVSGTTIAPHLIVSLKPDGPINTKELFVQTVCAGRPEKGMPAWCALGLDMNNIQAIYAYVKGRSDAKIGPGRPAVKPGT